VFITILKRSVGALMALIGGLLPIAIFVFILGIYVMTGFRPTASAREPFYSLVVVPLQGSLSVPFFAFLVKIHEEP
jgi:hypothetical protein